RRWRRASLGEPSGFVAAVASLHADGRVREQAVHALGAVTGVVAVAALAVRLLDHVPQVRERARASLSRARDVEAVEVLVDVLRAGVDRQHAGDALARVEAQIVEAEAGGVGPSLLPGLLRSGRRRV
ncbi:hypothetical protein, partial [Cellulomonas bogoriensis]|uniref:hypothetical protein n=1 Tax=Cellulomonas bogoriensis TaxID=301388 RepID=UPI00054DCB5F